MGQTLLDAEAVSSIRNDISAAIAARGVDLTGVTFGGFAAKIGDISGGVDPSQADATAADVLSGRTFFAVDSALHTGTLAPAAARGGSPGTADYYSGDTVTGITVGSGQLVRIHAGAVASGITVLSGGILAGLDGVSLPGCTAAAGGLVLSQGIAVEFDDVRPVISAETQARMVNVTKAATVTVTGSGRMYNTLYRKGSAIVQSGGVTVGDAMFIASTARQYYVINGGTAVHTRLGSGTILYTSGSSLLDGPHIGTEALVQAFGATIRNAEVADDGTLRLYNPTAAAVNSVGGVRMTGKSTLSAFGAATHSISGAQLYDAATLDLNGTVSLNGLLLADNASATAGAYCSMSGVRIAGDRATLGMHYLDSAVSVVIDGAGTFVACGTVSGVLATSSAGMHTPVVSMKESCVMRGMTACAGVLVSAATNTRYDTLVLSGATFTQSANCRGTRLAISAGALVSMTGNGTTATYVNLMSGGTLSLLSATKCLSCYQEPGCVLVSGAGTTITPADAPWT